MSMQVTIMSLYVVNSRGCLHDPSELRCVVSLGRERKARKERSLTKRGKRKARAQR